MVVTIKVSPWYIDDINVAFLTPLQISSLVCRILQNLGEEKEVPQRDYFWS